MIARLSLVAATTALALHAASAQAVVAAPTVTVTPGIGSYGQEPVITVRGFNASALEVRLSGASTPTGTPHPWRPLVLRDGVWSGRLAAPALRGAYPIELRSRSGAGVLRSPRWIYRIYAPGTLSRPAFDTPEEVAAWWVATVPRARVVAMRRWPRPDFDHRDPRLHALVVVAYHPTQHHEIADNLGMFITAVRDGFNGRWRLLEASVQP